MEPVPTYSRLPLNQNRKGIRLLQLWPGRRSDKLCGALKVVSLEDQRSYEALSYVWGASNLDPKPSIVIDSESVIALTDNLFNALRRLRRRFRTRTLWIDAICINQDDLLERSHQVSFMGEIYRAAIRVCVWLGDAPDISFVTHVRISISPLWLLPFTYRLRSHAIPTFWDYLFKITIARYSKKIRVSCADLLSKAITPALCDTDPPWHTRSWVYQELNQARDLLWYFGPFSKAFAARDFAEACLEARYSNQHRGDQQGFKLITDFARNLEELAKIVWWERKREITYCTLLNNAVTAQNLSAKDLRDRVYSLLSVSRQEEAMFLRSDYTKTVSQVYTEATYASIIGTGNFDILRHVTLRAPRVEGLPSWTADFSRFPRIVFDFTEAFVMDMAIPSDMPAPLPNASLSLSGERLHVTAVLFDKVLQSASVLSRGTDSLYLASHEHLNSTLRKFSQPFHDLLMHGKGRRACTAYSHFVGLRTLEGGNLERAYDRLDEMLYDEFGVGDDIRYEYDSSIGFSIDWWSWGVGPTSPSRKSGYMGYPHEVRLRGYFQYLEDISAQHAWLFTTVAGFLGIAAEEPAEDDVVAIIYRCSFPLLLHPTGERSIFRGLVFVGGLLDGQLEDIWKRNGICTQEIVLY